MSPTTTSVFSGLGVEVASTTMLSEALGDALLKVDFGLAEDVDEYCVPVFLFKRLAMITSKIRTPKTIPMTFKHPPFFFGLVFM